jgi:branched-chain amino acid transport system permease protein
MIGIYSILAMGICLLMGYAGQISLGQAAFFGIAAYTSALLSTKFGLSPWLGLLGGMVLTGAIAYIVGRPLLGLPGHMLGAATFTIAIICSSLFVEMDFLTGGWPGIGNIPHFSIGGFVFSQDIHNFYFVWVIVLIVFLASWNLVNSKTGRALRSLHRFFGGSEIAAITLGVNAAKLKTLVFVISAVYCAIAGSLYAHYVTHVTPDPFEPTISLMIINMVVIGGMRSLWGALVGAIFYIGIKEVISLVTQNLAPGASAEYEIIAFALLFLIMLRFAPQGLVQLPSVVLKAIKSIGRIGKSSFSDQEKNNLLQQTEEKK